MIKTEQEYLKTIDQWNQATAMYWPWLKYLGSKYIPDAGIMQRWRHRSEQLDQRLQQYEKNQPRGWRGGREWSYCLKNIKKSCQIISRKYPFQKN